MKRTITCPKCGGSGVIREFAHIDNGMCYRCLGTGTIEINDDDEWIIYKVGVTRSREFAQSGHDVYHHSGTYGKITARSDEWALKIDIVLSMWECDFRGPRQTWSIDDSQKAWDKMLHLKNTKSGKEMAKLINTEYDRAETCPYVEHKYFLGNKDTEERIWCDKDGNPT